MGQALTVLRRWWTTTSLVLVIAVCGGSLASSHAASMGGIHADSLMTAIATGGSGVPSVLACDDFTGTTGASLDGRTVTVAARCANRTWTVHGASWSLTSNRVAPDSRRDTVATIDTGTNEATVQVDLTGLDVNNRRGGVVLCHDGNSSYLAALAVNTGRDRVDLLLVNGGRTTTVASTRIPLTATSTTLRLAKTGAAVTVEIDGLAVLSHSLTPAEASTLSGSRAGLIGGSPLVDFDDFVVTSP